MVVSAEKGTALFMDITLPRLGEGAESGTVVSVFVKPGDQIKEGQTIVELENEKAVAPIPASAAGRVAKVYVKEGDKVPVMVKEIDEKGRINLSVKQANPAFFVQKPETPKPFGGGGFGGRRDGGRPPQRRF